MSDITSEGANLAVQKDQFINFALLGRVTRHRVTEDV